MKLRISWLLTVLMGLLSQCVLSAEAYRIHSAQVVREQAIQLTLDPYGDDYSGSTTLALTLAEDLPHVTLHWDDIDVSRIVLRKDGEVRPLNHVESDWDMHLLGDGHSISAGDYVLELDFRSRFARDALGLYRADSHGKSYLFTQFEAMYGRRAFPMVDEPDSKIPWQLTITSPQNIEALSNTPVATQRIENGWVTRTFEKTRPMPSYLLALAVGEFDKVEIPDMAIPSHIVAPRGMGDNVGYAAQVTPDILKFQEKYFGLPYPYRKLDSVAVPDLASGAMENVGLITYRTEFLLNGETPTPNSAMSTAGVIAHELAHQWYGNLVTMAWWDDLWLNEAFASQMGSRTMRALYPEFDPDLVLPQYYAFDEDALAATRPVRKEVRTNTEILEGLGLNYSKGEAILNMLEQAMGETAFRDGVRKYINANKWRNASASDLWAALDPQASFSVGAVAESFLNQSAFPLVTFAADGSVEQRRFVNAGADLPPQQWVVPMSVIVARGDKIETITLNLDSAKAKATELVEVDWIMPAAGGNGYYVWQIPTTQYRNLLDNLGQLTARERLAVLYNSRRLISGAQIPMSQHMQLVSALARDSNEALVLKNLEQIRYVAELYRGTPIEPAIRAWVSSMLDPWYEKLGGTPRATDTVRETKLRSRVVRILAQFGDSQKLRRELAHLANQWLADPNAVDGAIALEAVRMNAMFFGDANLARKYINAYVGTSDAVVRWTLYRGMYFVEPESLNEVMAALGKGIFVPGDMTSILRGLFYANSGNKGLYTALEPHFDDIFGRLPASEQSLLPELLGSSCNRENVERQEAFFAERGHSFKTSQSKAREASENCINTRQRERESVERFLSAS